MSLRDGTKKMSKSDPSDLSRINLLDPDDIILDKIKRAKTDMEPLPDDLDALERRPEIDNLVGIFAAMARCSKEDALDTLIKTSSHGPSYFTHFKRALGEILVERLGPMRTETQRLMRDPAEIDRILADGSARARAVTEPVMAKVKDIVGFIRS
jgi:tryptophanyl-tRNA synthetase